MSVDTTTYQSHLYRYDPLLVRPLHGELGHLLLGQEHPGPHRGPHPGHGGPQTPGDAVRGGAGGVGRRPHVHCGGHGDGVAGRDACTWCGAGCVGLEPALGHLVLLVQLVRLVYIPLAACKHNNNLVYCHLLYCTVVSYY